MTMISQSVEYALRAVVQLAYHSPNSCTTDEIAKVTQVPSAYLSKVLQGLNKAGIVKSQRVWWRYISGEETRRSQHS